MHSPDGRLPGGGGQLDVHADDIKVRQHADEFIGQRAVRLQVSAEAEVADQREQLQQEVGVQERLAAGDRDGVMEAGLRADEALDRIRDVVRGERIQQIVEVLRAGGALDAACRRRGAGGGRVAVGAVEIAASEAHEHLPLTDEQAFALDGGEEFVEGGVQVRCLP